MANVDVDRDPGSPGFQPDAEPDDALARLLHGRPGPLRSRVAAIRSRQQLFRRLIDWRHMVTTQEAVAEAMQTSQSAVARLEKGGGDPKVSTLERYATAIGARIRWVLAPDEEAVADSPHLGMAKVRWASASMLGTGGLADVERLRRARTTVEDLLGRLVKTEQEVARLAAERRTADDVGRLRRALDALPEVPREGFDSPEELAECRRAYREFHLVLAAASRDDQLVNEVAQLRDRLMTFLKGSRRGGLPPTSSVEPRQLYRGVLAAVERGDPDRAAAAMAEQAGLLQEVVDELLIAQLQRPQIMETVLQVRETSECLAARLAAERRTEADRERLQAALSRMQDASSESPETADGAVSFCEADGELHRAIADASHDPVVGRLATVAHEQFLQLVRAAGIESAFRDLRAQRSGHRAVVEAICGGKPEEAVRAMAGVIASTRLELKPALEGMAVEAGDQPRRST
jgi:DNA-binding FadR family transcriptional regulator